MSKSQGFDDLARVGGALPKKVSGGDAAITVPVVNGDILEAKIDKRVEEMLTLCTEPKDVIAAVKVAAEWYRAKKGLAGGGEWGKGL